MKTRSPLSTVKGTLEIAHDVKMWKVLLSLLSNLIRRDIKGDFGKWPLSTVILEETWLWPFSLARFSDVYALHVGTPPALSLCRWRLYHELRPKWPPSAPRPPKVAAHCLFAPRSAGPPLRAQVRLFAPRSAVSRVCRARLSTLQSFRLGLPLSSTYNTLHGYHVLHSLHSFHAVLAVGDNGYCELQCLQFWEWRSLSLGAASHNGAGYAGPSALMQSRLLWYHVECTVAWRA